MPAKKDSKRGSKARKAPVRGTCYTDTELNARVRGFPPLSEIWNVNRTDPVLLNPEQIIDTSASAADGELVKAQATFHCLKLDDKIVFPFITSLRSHLRLRRYKTNVVVEHLGLLSAEDPASERLYGWHLSPHEKRRSVALLKLAYKSDTVQFRADACAFYRGKFGDWLSRRAISRHARQSISSHEGIFKQLSYECAIIEILRRAVSDAKYSATEWRSIFTGKHEPSLNKLHRIVNAKQIGVDEMTSDEMVVTALVVGLFGCVNAASVYPKLSEMEDALQILCFFGRINCGEIWPTAEEARAYLYHCDGTFDGARPPAARDILHAADNLCGWRKVRDVLADICRKTIEADNAGRSLPPRFGRLWPMV